MPVADVVEDEAIINQRKRLRIVSSTVRRQPLFKTSIDTKGKRGTMKNPIENELLLEAERGNIPSEKLMKNYFTTTTKSKSRSGIGKATSRTLSKMTAHNM